VDASLADDRLTLACAFEVEKRAARKGGARAVRVGLAASLPIPQGRLVSFGLAGALVPGLEPGMLLTATRIVGEDGVVLWTGQPLPVSGAKPAVLCGATRIVDEPEERRALAERTGAVAVDLESAALARTGRLAGAVRAVSDNPSRPLGKLAHASTPEGGVAWRPLLGAFVTQPIRSIRTAMAARRGIAALERAAVNLTGVAQ
jgi:adenosylhomocysteine nucleosidase